MSKREDAFKNEKTIQSYSRSFQSRTVIGEDGKPVTEKYEKSRRLVVNKDGDVLEEKDKYKELPGSNKISKTTTKRINDQKTKYTEVTNTKTNEIYKDKFL